MSGALLTVSGLAKHYGEGAKTVRIIDDIGFSIGRGKPLLAALQQVLGDPMISQKPAPATRSLRAPHCPAHR